MSDVDGIERWGLPVESTTEAEFIRRRAFDSAIYRIDCGWAMPLYLYIRNEGKDDTLVSFAGAQMRRRTGKVSRWLSRLLGRPSPSRRIDPPFFSGSRIADGLGMNVVLVSDPGLELSPRISLAWYAGADGIDLQPRLNAILSHVCNVLGQRSLFFGSSGGGFAALYYGAKCDASYVVVMNPQILIERYPQNIVRIYARLAFGARTWPAAVECLRGRICSDIRDVWRGLGQPPLTYLQNIKDEHLTNHLEPFLQFLGLRFESEGFDIPEFRLVLGDWGEGHHRAPRHVVRREVEIAVKRMRAAAKI